jgi:GTPase SAR1 family protein
MTDLAQDEGMREASWLCVDPFTKIHAQYTSGRFSTNYRATIGADFITKAVAHHSNPEESIQLQIWVSRSIHHLLYFSAYMYCCEWLMPKPLSVLARHPFRCRNAPRREPYYIRTTYKFNTDTPVLQDTAGQERFSSLATAFFRGADAVILVYDVTDPASLPSLAKWWDEFRTRAPVQEGREIEFPVAVVGPYGSVLTPANI